MRASPVIFLFFSCAVQTPTPSVAPTGATASDVAPANNQSSEDVADEDTPLEPGEAGFFKAYTAAICNNAAPCCKAVSLRFNHDACAKEAESRGESWPKPAEPYKVDQQAASDCIELVKQDHQSCAVQTKPSIDGPCNNVFVYTGKKKQPGDGCEHDSECAEVADASETSCHRPFCWKTIDVKLGEVCSGQSTSEHLSYRCEPGTICVDKYCEKGVAPVGELCGNTRCKKGFYCNSANGCEAYRKAGEPCDFGTRCEGSCAWASKTCVDDAFVSESTCGTHNFGGTWRSPKVALADGFLADVTLTITDTTLVAKISVQGSGSIELSGSLVLGSYYPTSQSTTVSFDTVKATNSGGEAVTVSTKDCLGNESFVLGMGNTLPWECIEKESYISVGSVDPAHIVAEWIRINRTFISRSTFTRLP